MKNFDPEITARMRRFVESDRDGRDYDDAAEILHVVTGNSVQYRMLKRKGARNFADVIDRKIRELFEFRLARLTHEEVRAMKAKADAIAASSVESEERLRNGRRADHDRLPEEIQVAYKEALDCLHMQRELHMQIRNLALRNSSCPDSELYPFVKEIIRIDEKRLALWKRYDDFSPE